MLSDSRSLNSTAIDLDQVAWKAICTWHHHVDVPVIQDGIDLAELCRYLLWDKVARAIRQQLDPDAFRFEADLLDPNWCRSNQPVSTHPLKQQAKYLRQRFYALQDGAKLRAQATSLLYVPTEHPTLRRTIASLSTSVATVVPDWAYPNQANLHRFRAPFSPTRSKLALPLHHAIVQGLAALDITLIEHDVQMLKRQIIQVLTHLEQVKLELKALRPNAILLFADNHYPVQSYVFAARQAGIPTVMLQHGLDCERFCLDEAYASVISVWGQSRFDRYRQDSTWQPQRIQISGNPEFDTSSLPSELDLAGDYWLWVTRPHRPEKCYVPSRSPREGLEILSALLQALARSPSARLVIKPHPLDHPELYQAYVNASTVRDRVEISTQNPQLLLPQAQLVISEDSTVGLEAMLFGKVVVHAHFADSAPVLPFVDYGAALPGFSAEALIASIEHSLSDREQQQLWQGQQRFIQDYAGQCDGKAHQRIIQLIQDVLQR